MNQPISLYDALGRITVTAQVSEGTYQLYKQSHLPLLDAEYDPALFYVQKGVACLRPSNPAILSEMQLQHVPITACIVINGLSYPVSVQENTLEFTTVDLAFTYPGSYVVVVQCFPYLDATFNVLV